MTEGWIKLHRKFLEWEWFNKSEIVHIFLYLLLSANNKNGSWRGIKVKRGQVLTGRKAISDATKLSEQTIRTCLKKLLSTSEISIKSTSKYSIITICKYESYQETQIINQPTTNQQLTSNQPTTNHKQEYKKDKKEENNIKEERENIVAANAATLARKDIFYKTLIPHSKNISIDILRAFFDYWSEMNKSQTKMRFEFQKTWEVSKRITTWVNREKINGKSYIQAGTDPDKAKAIYKAEQEELKLKREEWKKNKYIPENNKIQL